MKLIDLTESEQTQIREICHPLLMLAMKNKVVSEDDIHGQISQLPQALRIVAVDYYLDGLHNLMDHISLQQNT